MGMKFTNFATSTLASGILAGATSLSVFAGDGAKFPVLGAGDYFYAVLENLVGAREIIKVTARTGDSFGTIVRAQDGTSALAWNAGDKVELRVVNANMADFPKLDEVNTFSLAQTFTTAPIFTNAAGTRSNLGAAASGANTDITSVLSSVSGMVLIASATASNSATIDFTSISNATYDSYKIVITDLIPATNNTNLLLRTSAGGVFRSTADYSWQNLRWTTAANGATGQTGVATGIALDAAGADNMSNTVGGSWVIDFFNCSNTTLPKRCVYQGRYFGSTEISISGSGTSAPTTAVDGFRFLMDSGNITSGIFKLYGLKA